MARRFVELTDDPAPAGSRPQQSQGLEATHTEQEARRWMKELPENPEFETDAGDRGWRYGHTATIKPWTRE